MVGDYKYFAREDSVEETWRVVSLSTVRASSWPWLIAAIRPSSCGRPSGTFYPTTG
jgi:hypothetical protein